MENVARPHEPSNTGVSKSTGLWAVVKQRPSWSSCELQVLEDILDDDADMADMYLARRAHMSATSLSQIDSNQQEAPTTVPGSTCAAAFNTCIMSLDSLGSLGISDTKQLQTMTFGLPVADSCSTCMSGMVYTALGAA